MKLHPAKTKIIATIGPSSRSPKTVRKLVQSGVAVFRINASHGTHEEHKQNIDVIRSVSRELAVSVGIMCDFQGPKLRIGRFSKNSGALLKRHQLFVLMRRRVLGTDEGVSAPTADFYRYVKKGEIIYVNDGKIQLRVERIRHGDIHCRVLEGGTLTNHKGVNLPFSQRSFPILTAKDKQDIQFAIRHRVGIFAFSFIQTPQDVRYVRRFLANLGWEGLLISKIEKPRAVEQLDEIIRLSDGILIARGDLGVEMELAKVPWVQKTIIKKCNEQSKIVITATQMLESMITSHVPTRAEVSDVANAVYDGTDAVMLSAETASGLYPVQAVEIMRAIILEVERTKAYQEHRDTLPARTVTHVVTRSAVQGAEYLRAKLIVCHTESGNTAGLISKCHPTIPVVAFTPHMDAYIRMSMYYGVYPILAQQYPTTEKMIAMGDRELIRRKLCRNGDKVVIVAGEVQLKGATNMMKVHSL